MRTPLLISLLFFAAPNLLGQSFIRLNQLGYPTNGTKVAVWCSKAKITLKDWQLVDSVTGKVVFKGLPSAPFGSYGPFQQSYRLDFSEYKKPGRYFLRGGGAQSPVFTIGNDVYKGSADFCLRYMRQQRSGFNPFLKDSCHTMDGYVLYGAKAGIKDSTHIDVVGGWHDASDYLQYSTTSANATFHLLMAYRDFPLVFSDKHEANGLAGKNSRADVLDEAKWGLDWLLKMNPRPGIMFNQVGDDRDHIRMRLPGMDSQYGKGFERPVYFVTGEPQQQGKGMNHSTGTSSIAAKFGSAFALGAEVFQDHDTTYSHLLWRKESSASNWKSGNTQTASVMAPYIYTEGNWSDDEELYWSTAMSLYRRYLPGFYDKVEKDLQEKAFQAARQEKITPWMKADTASHYQWYPFINLGHYQLARQLNDARRDTLISYYREGIETVWNRARTNPFYRGVPFIWCSNNLTVAFAIQCYWYRILSGDETYLPLEQANFDWLFGCNPWGTSMVYGLPSFGDTPVDPHSAFTHIGHFPIDGGLVDGPVYTGIFKNLIGIRLNDQDEYATFQSDLAVYHDDYGDYSTNEPTMDGTASLVYLMAAKESEAANHGFSGTLDHGAIVRGNPNQRTLALVFTGHEYAEGGDSILHALKNENVVASFFFTGEFYRNSRFFSLVHSLRKEGHYLGPHSDRHLLYCDWKKRDSLLVSRKEFQADLERNYSSMAKFGIGKKNARFFLPPYEWYNDSIAAWTKDAGLQLINYTPGTLSHADYTGIGDSNYRSSEVIMKSILDYEKKSPEGLNGFILLMHVGAGPAREDKFYERLPELIKRLKQRGYQFETVDQLIGPHP